MLWLAGLLAGSMVAASAAAAAAAPSCDAASLRPELHELMVSQGLPSYTSLVRGKDTIIRAFLSKPDCAARNQTVTVTDVGVAVANTSASPTVPLGAGTLFAPTSPVNLPAFYTGTPPADSPSDPILTVPGSVLTPCGGASCAQDAAGFSATFTVTVSYTATGTTGTQTAAFAATKAVAQKSNALRLLVVPMGDAGQLRSSQYTLAADAAVQQGMSTLSRILPVPCDADPADSTGACFATSLLSSHGGIRYTVSPGILDLRAVPGAYDSAGRFCGTQASWDALKGTLAQFLQSWNTANPEHTADRVIGVADETISSGVGTSPAGYSCADGMAATGSVAAWVRAMYAQQPSRTGGLLAMELSHTFGGVPYPRSFTTHSSSSAADGTAPGRAYDLNRRAHIAGSRSVMKYDTSLPWNNDTTLFEQLDQELLLCHLGGPPNAECATSGSTGAVTGAGAGITVVLSGTTGFTPDTTEVVMSYRSDDVAQPRRPAPEAPQPDSPTRLLVGGPVPANLGVPTSSGQTDHSPAHNDELSEDNHALVSLAFEGVPGMTSFTLYHCPAGTQACKDDPVGHGGVPLYEAHQQPTQTVIADTVLLDGGAPRTWTNDPSRLDTNPAVQSGAVAWVAACRSCGTGATTIHLAPESDVTQVVEIPLSADGAAQTDPAWRSDGLAVAWSAGGDIWTATVDRSTLPYTVGGATRIHAQGGANPAGACPTWSTDGSKVYFCATNGGIRWVPATGGTSSPLVSTPAHETQPSAGPTRLAYTKTSPGGGTAVWTVNPAKPASTQKLLRANADQPHATADGRVLFREAGRIMSINLDGSGLEQVTAGPDDQNPDSSGSTVAFDRPVGSDREVMLASTTGRYSSSTFTGPDAARVRGELQFTSPDGATHTIATGVEPILQSATQGRFEASYDESGSSGGTGTLRWICSDGFDLCTQGPGSTFSVVNSNKPPVAAITSPAAATVISTTSRIALNGSASSLQGQLAGPALRWYASGSGLPETFLGAGNRFDVAAPPGGWPNGPLTIRLQATDGQGQTSSATRVVTVDGIAPTASVVAAPPPVTSSTTITIDFEYADMGGSTTTTVLCQLDGGEKVPCTSPVTYTGLTPGEHLVTIFVIDEAGNETQVEVPFIVDGAAPISAASLSPAPGASGWSTTDVQVTLTATDPSGVQSITYSMSGAQTGGATVPGGTATFTVSAEGVTSIAFSATDGAGLVEASQQQVVQIDRVGPSTAISGEPSLLGLPACISLLPGCEYSGSATDGGSGVASVRLAFTSGGQTTTVTADCAACGPGATSVEWTWSPAVLELLPGIYTVTAMATDVAGNVGPATSASSTLHVL